MRPMKIRYEKGSFFVVLPREVIRLAGMKRGDYVVPLPSNDGIFLKLLKEVGHGEDRKDTDG